MVKLCRTLARLAFTARRLLMHHIKVQDNYMNCKFAISIAVAVYALLTNAGQAIAAPATLSESQMDNVAAGLVAPTLTMSNFYNTGAIALANSGAVSTPSGTAFADVLVQTSIGLSTTGFSSSLKFGIVR